MPLTSLRVSTVVAVLTLLLVAGLPRAAAAGGARAIAAGMFHTCAVTSTGGVRCWGWNLFGELGDGTVTNRLTPVDVSGLTAGVTAVAVGHYHTCALTTAGGVKCWGRNGGGQLGDGTMTDRLTPTDVAGLTSGVVAVAAGTAHTCALSSAGGLQCWGSNAHGGLGDGTAVNRPTAADVIGLDSGVAAVAAGDWHTCAVTTSGGLKCWGRNWEGQLGDDTHIGRATPIDVPGLTSGIVAVTAGATHTCALTAAGGLKCWGYNFNGQVGSGTGALYQNTPVDVPGLTAGVEAVSAAQAHTCARTSGGAIACWGLNSEGELGDGGNTIRSTWAPVLGLTRGAAAVSVGGLHSCAVTTGGGVKCWGDNDMGALGDGTTTGRLTPVPVRGFSRPDFDGDERSDVAVYRSSSGTWFSLDSATGNTKYSYRGWGAEAHGDEPIVGDFDGDGILDPTVFRPESGTWFVLKSGGNFTTWDWFGWGSSTDTPVPGDYDGDGLTDAAVYRASDWTWYVRPSSGGAAWSIVFGDAADVPVAGDFDGDGRRDPAVYRPSMSEWYWLKSSTNYTVTEGRTVGAPGDTPAPGDYDGDGRTDLCVFRPSTGTWIIRESGLGFTTFSDFGWGTAGDQPVPGDYDGDGKTDGAVYRASTGTWYIRPSSGATPWSVVFGAAGDVPLVTRQ